MIWYKNGGSRIMEKENQTFCKHVWCFTFKMCFHECQRILPPLTVGMHQCAHLPKQKQKHRCEKWVVSRSSQFHSLDFHLSAGHRETKKISHKLGGDICFPGGTMVKNPPANAGDARDAGLTPRSGRSPGEGNGTHSSILAWKIPQTEDPGRQATVHGVTESQTWLSE